MSHVRSRPTTVSGGILLTIGFLALTGAVLVARSSPATGYELSPYTSTPLSFWLLFGCAVSIALVVSFRAATVWNRRLALLLGGSATAAFAGLPVIRGYWFYGAGDALTHLGWMRAIRSGSLSPLELRYPALHTVSTLLSVTFGIELRQAALLVVVALSCLFFLFVALSTSLAFDSRYSSAVGAFAAFLLLPITTLSTFMVPHAMSQAILFSAVAFYLLLKYVRDPTSSRSSTAVGALFAITLVSIVLYHPQLAAHLLVAFVGICAVQLLYRRYRTAHPVADHRPMYAQTVVLVIAFLAWTANHDFFRGAVEYAFESAIEFFLGTGEAASSVNSQSASLTELGASIGEVVLKLFGPSMVVSALAGLLVLWAIVDRDGTATRETDGILPYFVVSMVGWTGLFVLYFVGSYSEMYFRVFGLMMVLVTVVGAAAVAYGMNARSGSFGTTTVASAAFGLLLVFSLIAVFPSPYIYNASPHVTEMSMAGHEAAFESQDDELSFVGIRAGPDRYEDAIYAREDRTRGYGSVTGEEIDDGLPSQFDEDRYLTVTQTDRDREVRAYGELRYSEAQLDAIATQPGVDRVQSNGEFELYHVRSTAEG